MSDVFNSNSAANLEALQKSVDDVRKFAEASSTILPFTDDEIAGFVSEEVSHGAIILDSDGLTSGLKDRIFPRIRQYQQGFREASQSFAIKFEPFKSMIKERATIPDKILALEATRDKDIAQAERDFHNEEAYKKYADIKAKFDYEVKIHKSQPNLAAVSPRIAGIPLYWFGIGMLGIAEYFINYDTIESFLGIPAFAVAATLVIGLVFAFCAHAHGTFIKQWKRKFGIASKREDRPWIWFSFTTVAILFVLSIVGWIRYDFVMAQIGETATQDLLGNVQPVSLNPIFEVVLSLGGNIAVWIAGVMIAYFCHDEDEHYVKTAIDERKARAAYNRVLRKFNEEIEHLRAKFDQESSEQNNIAATIDNDQALRMATTLKEQLTKYEESISQRVKTFVMIHMTRYKSQLLNSLNSNPNLLLYRQTSEQTVFVAAADYKNTLMSISDKAIGKHVELESI